MKNHTLIRCLLAFTMLLLCADTYAQKKGNAIDRLKKRKHVEVFMQRFFKDYVSPEKHRYDMKAKPCIDRDEYYKLDVDGNGTTDLIENGLVFAIVRDMGNDSFSTKKLWQCGGDWENVQLRKVDTKANPPIIYIGAERSDSVSALTHWRGLLVEHNATPAQHRIERIRFAIGICPERGCTGWEVDIKPDGSAMYKSSWVHERPLQFFKGHIPAETMDTITGLLNYQDFPKLESYYTQNTIHMPDVALIVTYNNGQVKKIEDHGGEGTYGLQEVYRILRASRLAYPWKLLNTVEGEPTVDQYIEQWNIEKKKQGH